MSLKNIAMTPGKAQCIITRTTVQNIADVTWTKVAHNSNIYDPLVMHDLAGTITFPYSGLWHVWAHLSYLTNGNGVRIHGLGNSISSTNCFTDVRSLGNASYDHGLEANTLIRVNKGDVVQQYTYQNSGTGAPGLALFNNTPTYNYAVMATYFLGP